MTPRTRRGSKFPSQYDDHILDPYFMDKAIQRFPTPRSAIDGLRLIEKPQKGLLYTLSYPGGDVETFLAVAASLAECMRGNRQEQQVAVILLRNNWISLIGPWVMTTIEELILPDLEPDAPAISTIREQAMWILPYLLYPPKLFTRIEFSIRELRDLTPDLALFLSRVWVNVIDRHHRTWGLWTNLLASLARGDLVQGPAHLTTHKVFESLHPLGHIFLRHLNYETPHVPTMDDDQLIEFNNFLLLTNCDQYGGRGPLNMEGVEKYALPALVRVVSCLLYKRKMLREHGVDSEREGSIVMLVLDNIYRMMDGFVRVSEALEAGITVALIRAYPLYFELDPRPPCPELDQERPPRFEEQALKILERIAKYLVFPVVLHQFLRLSKRVMWSKEMEKQLRSKSKALWTAWKQAQNKAIILRDIRRSLIADGCFWKCSNTSCKSSYGNSGVKFLRCSGCLGVVYCSRNCQALHWNHDHRKKCGETSRLRDSGLSYPSTSDQLFVQRLTDHFVDENETAVTRGLAEYLCSLHSSHVTGRVSDMQRLILKRIKNPIAIIDLVKEGPPLMENLTIVDPEELGKHLERRIGPQKINPLIESWKSQAPNIQRMFVVALFPMRGDTSAGVGFEFEFSVSLKNVYNLIAMNGRNEVRVHPVPRRA